MLTALNGRLEHETISIGELREVNLHRRSVAAIAVATGNCTSHCSGVGALANRYLCRKYNRQARIEIAIWAGDELGNRIVVVRDRYGGTTDCACAR